ncbi:MAG: AAA domain-containing protein [Pseudonocardia sp.]|nr:AAA domain-containing protein [Pseudonocardia sp.]
MSGNLRRRALLVGTEIYHDPQFARLPSTRADTTELRGVLEDRTIGGFDVTVGSDLTAAQMRSEILDFCRDSDAEELTLVYISGHGARGPDGEFVFVATDTEFQRLSDTGVPAGFVNSCLEDCYAGQRIAVFDTCESGSFSLGFRTRETKGAGTASPAPVVPLRARGVYVLASSDVAQSSYSGPESTVADPTPSVFTGAVVEILREGSAGASTSGFVSVDDLYDAVHHRLLALDPPQTPLKSSNGVIGSMTIAARPMGRSPRAVDERGRDTAAPAAESGGSEPDWPTLLRYYADVVRAESGRPPLLTVGSDDHVVLTGAERALRGEFDADGTIALPEGAEALVQNAAADYGPTLWMGWPTVVLHHEEPGGRPLRVPGCAPLLMRRVQVVAGGQDIRLRPEGEIVPHPGLAAAWLGEEEAAALAASYQPTWHSGESAAMARDAGHLLTDTFALPCIEELRPERLTSHIDVATAGPGARNAAVLFGITADTATVGLLKDFGKILQNPTSVPGTALAALYPGAPAVPAAPEVPLTMPLPANPAQQAVLHSAMTQRLTVATGPPGTGKSQLVVDAVATAVAAGQSVLVASTNNRAVDEVHERCERILPGMMLRTGNAAARTVESRGLESLRQSSPARRSPETRKQALAHARRELATAESRLRDVATSESELVELGEVGSRGEHVLGSTGAELGKQLGPDWGTRAASLARAWFFGEWRRGRFLEPTGCALESTAATCEAIAHLADVERRLQSARSAAAGHPDDTDLLDELDRAQRTCAERAAESVAGTVLDLTRDGERQVRELWQAGQRRGPDWGELGRARRYLRSWAVTSLSVRRFPPDPAAFDLVIIDEASQCTIPSIVPLLYRATRALVIGDAMQLPHISSVRAEADMALRVRWDVSRRWLADHRLSPVRHSAFAAAEQAAGEPLLLDEHYRCHPDIAEVANRLFYQGRLAVLTDLRSPQRVRVEGPAIVWRDVAGAAEHGRAGKSWHNPAEAEEVVRIVEALLAGLPPEATIGVVTPYRPQADALEQRLSSHGDRVRSGTAHRFQGGERDVMVLSLVAGRNHQPRRFDWVDQQPELWNVAITRARSQLIVVGDAELWARRGRVGAELLRAARGTSATAGTPLDDELAQRLYSVLVDVAGPDVELGASVDGHRADGLLPDGRPVIVDPGSGPDGDGGAHLHRILQRSRLLGPHALRIPAWTLSGDGRDARHLVGPSAPGAVARPHAVRRRSPDAGGMEMS